VKEHLRALVSGAPSPRNLVREYLQARILLALQRSGAMIPLAFQGGTALRFLFGIPRFSEDLEFAAERDGFDLRASLVRVRSDLEAEGYAVAVKANDKRVVHSAFVRFPGLLHDLGLSPHASEVQAIKLEIDTQPPPGAVLATTVVRRAGVTLQLQHHDRASLLAGKLHALLQRPYAKGRDLYDLLWYLADREWPAPNLVLLDNALRQTGAAAVGGRWPSAVKARLNDIDWEAAVDDVRPFLEPHADVAALTRANLFALLDQRRS
jgi:hypothetical protein